MNVLNIFSFHTPWNIFLRELWVENVHSTMVIWRKVDFLRPVSTYIMTMDRKTQLSTNLTYIIEWRGTGMRPISTYIITIKTLSTIVKVKVAGLLRPKFRSSIITTNITSFIVIRNFMNTTRRVTQDWVTKTDIVGGSHPIYIFIYLFETFTDICTSFKNNLLYQ